MGIIELRVAWIDRDFKEGENDRCYSVDTFWTKSFASVAIGATRDVIYSLCHVVNTSAGRTGRNKNMTMFVDFIANVLILIRIKMTKIK